MAVAAIAVDDRSTTAAATGLALRGRAGLSFTTFRPASVPRSMRRVID